MTEFFASTRHEAELLEEFFESGMEESISPFLTPSSRHWGKNLRLKASLLAAFFLVIGYVSSFFANFQDLSHLSLLLTYFFAGVPALISAVEDIFKLEINIDVLMILAAFLAIFIGSEREGALLLVLFAFSNSLEKLVSAKAKHAIQALKSLSPTKASVIQADGTLLERSIRDITPGTYILVKAGQVIPLDGIIRAGSSFINLVHLTGENLPVTRGVNDTVQAGASNLDGALTIEVTHTSSDSTIARIIDMIHHAQDAKPTLQRWFDALTNRYALAVILCSFLFALLLPVFTVIPYLGPEGSIYRALAFLIAASPCALILAIPIAYLSAISACARRGILLKGGIVLDALARCTTLALDKTGTLTYGKLTYVGVEGEWEKETLPIAYALEQNIEHPMAQAICHYASQQSILPLAVENFKAFAGHGVEATVRGHTVFLGSMDWMLPKVPPNQRSQIEQRCRMIQEQGESLAILLVQDHVSIFRFSDCIRPRVLETLQILKDKLHMKVMMLTGDHIYSARAIAKETGITEYFADLKPEDKLRHIEQISLHQNLAMVGDGINDAPALARASVGIAMGGIGSHTAVAAADVILLQDHIDHLGWLFKKAHQAIRIVSQNICLAAAAILVAVVPALLGWLPLWLAVLLHEGGTVIVGLNALRLLLDDRS
ncbi:MAG: cation-translocating P-type ATPase [Verrucomicrobia bacterium]|nr:cation-translocating P-type ATPase [Verrucomicrobiota bacterium]MBS0645372.1 cation-translocating P-type ATPase [Verrucomicrobiota bacterium]